MKDKNQRNWKLVKRNWDLYLILLLPVTFLIVFKYIPMYGVQIAFKDYSIFKGIWDSPWIGVENFQRFFKSSEFSRLLKNTLILNIYNLIMGFPFPILFALCLNYIEAKRYKKTVQLITYAPHFISTTVIAGMILQFLSPRNGIVNVLLGFLGVEPIDFMASANYFPHIYVWTNVWQSMGYGSIIYIAALSSIDPSIHEAAIIDGASKFKRAIHVDLPGIVPTIIILLILNMGAMLSSGFEKIYLLQTPLNLATSEVIDTYVMKVGLMSPMANYSYPTAIGLFQSVVGIILIVTVNKIAKKVNEVTLW